MTNQEYMTIVNKVAFEADKVKPKMEPYKDDYNMGVYVGLLKAVSILRASYNSFTTELKPCEDWKFYYKHGYAQAKRDLLDEIKAEIEQNAYPIVHGVNNHEKGMTLYGILEIIDKYRAESEEEK